MGAIYRIHVHSCICLIIVMILINAQLSLFQNGLWHSLFLRLQFHEGLVVYVSLKEQIMSIINLLLKFTGVHKTPKTSSDYQWNLLYLLFFPFHIIYHHRMSIISLHILIYNTRLFTALDMYRVKWTSFEGSIMRSQCSI